jgi:hypothetical protein
MIDIRKYPNRFITSYLPYSMLLFSVITILREREREREQSAFSSLKLFAYVL